MMKLKITLALLFAVIAGCQSKPAPYIPNVPYIPNAPHIGTAAAVANEKALSELKELGYKVEYHEGASESGRWYYRELVVSWEGR